MELISVESLPPIDVDPDAARAAAQDLRIHASSVLQAGADLRAVWNGLGEVCDTPEAPTLSSRMDTVTEASTEFGRSFRRISGILTDLAEALAQAQSRLRGLRLEVDQLRRAVLAYRAGAADEHVESSAGFAGEVWGPGQYEWNAALLSERERIRALIEQAHDDAERDLRAVGDPAGVTLAAFSPPANPLAPSWQSRQDEFVTSLATFVLERLLVVGTSPRIEDLILRHPEWVELLRNHPPAPDFVARWWAEIGSSAEDALVAGAGVIVGSLGGVPASDRVEANRRLAARRLTGLKEEMKRLERDGPFGSQLYARMPIDTEQAVAAYRRRLAALRLEIDYLTRARDRVVKLYHYRPEHGEIIELFGDPDAAKSILTFMPGTNTTLESFYTAGKLEGVSALARWQVDHAYGSTPIAAFVIKQGAFPQLDFNNWITTGPQNNDMAESLGASYARFADEVRVIAPRRPIVSVEHSFGSAVGGVAETLGAKFHSRILLAGIGMTADYIPDPHTEKYGMQASNDINRHLDGAQLGNWGYALAPTRTNSVVPLESGLPGTPVWAALIAPLSPPIGVTADLISGFEQHNRIISADEAKNGQVLETIGEQLLDATRGGAS